ncbi:acyltransferase family protein [Paeniglutamicibacter sp. NPDC012692]|uniref:acyltransferase family protein n=1 Tax=Paeniglutamicibacter sp. NPDC012692 TaxID=3364388 RepID=UPI0036A6C0DB
MTELRIIHSSKTYAIENTQNDTEKQQKFGTPMHQTSSSGPQIPISPTLKTQGESLPACRRSNRAHEGLLGIATLLALLYHSNQTVRGFYALDALMLVTAFLATSNLIREQLEFGHINVEAYYSRTIKRYAPAAIFVLATTSLAILLVGNTTEKNESFPIVLATLGQFANWQQLLSGVPSWDSTTKIHPFAAMWTISLVAQFLIVLPLLFKFLWASSRNKLGLFTTYWLVLATVGASISPLLATTHTTERLYLGSDTHALPFLCGSLFATVSSLLQQRPKATPATDHKSSKSAVLWTGMALLAIFAIVVEHFLNEYVQKYPSGLIVICLGLGLLCLSLSMKTIYLHTFFGFPPFRALGSLSYEILLIHLPVFWALHTAFPTLSPITLLVYGGLATYALSNFAHFRITRLRFHKPWYEPRWNNWPLINLIATLLMTTTGLAIY